MKKKRFENPNWLQMPKRRGSVRVKSDELVRIPGVGTMARFGRLIEMTSNRSSGEQEALQAKLRVMHPSVEANIGEAVSRARRSCEKWNPSD